MAATITQEDEAAGDAGAAGLRRFMSFGVGGMSFAVPLAEVVEIIRRPELVRIPLGPPSLEGLARRLGEVLPVISLRRVFGLPEAVSDAARLLVVRHRGQPVGLVIDRMAAILAVPEDRIGAAKDAVPDGLPGEAAIDGELLAGVIRPEGASQDGEGTATVMILDAGPVIERQFGDLVRPDALPGTGGTARRADAAAAAQALDEIRIVGFDVAGQDFALPVGHVQEIVTLPAGITRVPRARPHLLGVMTLRDRLLPLVGLRELFGLTDGVTNDGARRRVVVVQAEDGEEGLVGVVVDGVREILRVERGRVDPVPPLMAREAEFEDVAGIARLDGGRRLVSILSAERMFRHSAALRATLGAAGLSGGDGAAEEESAMADGGVGGGVRERTEQFVVFRLAGAEYGLPVADVQEVLRRPDALTPLPNAPDFVAGIANLRGAVLPVIDQRRLLRLPEGAASSEGARGRIVVIGARDLRAGLLVDALSGIVRVPERCIDPAPLVSRAQQRLIRRVAHLEDGAGDRRMILLLDPAELLDMDQLATLLPSD
ncbi:chemotaxis protein CheW [Azospirillum sp. SYSU D00513]|uniref:chemotaxis protein CheW n=1 Tax=Azospirillum sp. SYSU D00513 TaxID=2812561 RepID=UPI001A97C7BB|nr:chemotaxis protein CheW [Azospirillum sp. SYSU D00513]